VLLAEIEVHVSLLVNNCARFRGHSLRFGGGGDLPYGEVATSGSDASYFFLAAFFLPAFFLDDFFALAMMISMSG
jgi:hypothetical protein